jgi:hypothetical protein
MHKTLITNNITIPTTALLIEVLKNCTGLASIRGIKINTVEEMVLLPK